MNYEGTIKVEQIVLSSKGKIEKEYVNIVKDGSNPLFYVSINDGKNEWFWEFDLVNQSDYELVRLTIFDFIFECETIQELACTLDGAFKDRFGLILINDDYNDDFVSEILNKFELESNTCEDKLEQEYLDETEECCSKDCHQCECCNKEKEEDIEKLKKLLNELLNELL